MSTVSLIVSYPHLKSSLTLVVRHLGWKLRHPHEPLLPGTTVLTTVKDCPLDHCRKLTARGLRVIVLASLPNSREHQEYLDAGATHYLGMAGGLEEIRQALSPSAG